MSKEIPLFLLGPKGEVVHSEMVPAKFLSYNPQTQVWSNNTEIKFSDVKCPCTISGILLSKLKCLLSYPVHVAEGATVCFAPHSLTMNILDL